MKPLYKLKNKRLKKEAKSLYEKGYSLREIGELLGKSHEWVRQVLLQDLSTDERLDNS